MLSKEMPITSYEEFSLEAEWSDSVYICMMDNYITSVHMDYYTENRKSV